MYTLILKVCMCFEAFYLYGFINKKGYLPDSINRAAKVRELDSLLFPVNEYSSQTMYGKYSIKVDNWHSTWIEMKLAK